MYRIEHDSIGPCQVPAEAYYGVHTMRAIENFSISGRPVHPLLVQSMVEIKKAAAVVHKQTGGLETHIADAMIEACNDLLAGRFIDQILVDAIQGGAGTSTNMNVNEVIANRALERLGYCKGDYQVIHPNDQINRGQSTNDVYPTAGRMALLKLLPGLLSSLDELIRAMAQKASQFDDVLKIGRTQLQDAVPIRLGQEFQVWHDVLLRDAKRIRSLENDLRVVNLGGTAIGTCINAESTYLEKIIPTLNQLTGLDLRAADNLIDATQNPDSLLAVSSSLRGCSVTLSKIANDLRLLSSGPKAGLGEITLPARQNGSSIMPGKINPVIPEVINQIAFSVMGHDVSNMMAIEAGQLELNAFEPILFDNLFTDIMMLTNGIKSFSRNCIQGIAVNRERCQDLLDRSAALATVLAPVIGYQKSADIAKRAIKENRPVMELIKQEPLAMSLDLSQILDVKRLTSPTSVSSV